MARAVRATWCRQQDIGSLGRVASPGNVRSRAESRAHGSFGDLTIRFEAAWVPSQMGEAAASAVPALNEIAAAVTPDADALRRALEDADPDVPT